MGRPNGEPIRAVSRLFTNLDDFLSVLPREDRVGDEIWQETPVSLEEWIADPEFMNLGEALTLSDIQMSVLKAMDNIDPSENRYTEFVIEWGKGSGKDFISALAALRQVYLLLCLRDCYDYYGMAKNTGIQLVNCAYTKEQAKNVYLKQVKGLLKGSPWFNRNGFGLTRDRILFDHQVELVSGAADGDSLEGQNMFFAVMDEASAFSEAKVVKAVARAEGVKPQKAADVIYNVLRSSTRSRFPRVGKVVMISYPRYRDDFIQTKRKECELDDGAWTSGPYCTWEVNPRVSEEELKNTQEYRERPEMARAMYECKPPYAEDPYIGRPFEFIRCVKNSIKEMPDLVSPIDDNGAYDPIFQGMPGRFYAIHVDLATRKDRCALALARQGEPVSRMRCPCNQWNLPDIEACVRCGRPAERWLRQELPTMVVTLLKSFTPRLSATGSKEVQLSDVRDEILYVRDRGHKIWALSYDGWQSVDSIQTMRKILGTRKVRPRYGRIQDARDEEIVNTLSVDRNTEAHDTLRDFIYDERFFITPPKDVRSTEDYETSEDSVAVAYREWRQLKLINGKKVDHPLGGSKDYVDALAGAAYWIAKMPLIRLRTSHIAGWSETETAMRATIRSY